MECLHLYVTFIIHHKLFYGNKQARQSIHCFVLNSHFIQSSECKYVLFVCLRFRNFGHRFSFHVLSVDLLGESRVVPPTLRFSRKKKSKLFFSAKIWRLENIPLYGTQQFTARADLFLK